MVIGDARRKWFISVFVCSGERINTGISDGDMFSASIGPALKSSLYISGSLLVF